jgi:GT2 family glycosyltransferase
MVKGKQHKMIKKNELKIYESVCVVVPVYNNFDIAKECIKQILKFTNPQVQILVIDDGSTEGEFRKLGEMGSHRIQHVRNPRNVGLVESLNNALEICDPKDLIILNSDVFVYENWLENLHLEAYENDLIATVTAMADNGGIASVQLGNRYLEDASEEDFININNYLSGLPSNPQISIPVGVGHCLYVKRTALNLVGKFDLRFSPGYGEEVDFCLRCVKIGFIHVISQKVLVRHKEGVSFGGRRKKLQIMHDKKIEDEYEFYGKYLETFEEMTENKNNLFLIFKSIVIIK